MKKKTLFVLVGSLALVALALLLFFLFRNKPSDQNDKPPTSESVDLPTEAENNQQNIQNVKTKIKDVTEYPVSSQAVEKGFEAIKFNDTSGDKIPLAEFKKSAEISVNAQLNTYLDNKDYGMYYCPADGEEKDYAVYFGYNVDKAYTNLSPDTLVWMKDWEKTIFSDLHTVLFPNMVFSQEELNQHPQFKDGKFRYAEIRLSGSKTGSINYYASLNGVIISSSPSCMEKMIGIYEPLEP